MSGGAVSVPAEVLMMKKRVTSQMLSENVPDQETHWKAAAHPHGTFPHTRHCPKQYSSLSSAQVRLKAVLEPVSRACSRESSGSASSDGLLTMALDTDF